MKKLIFIIILLIINVLSKKVKKDKEKESVSISKSEYCQGCIETVNVYANRLVKGLQKYEANSVMQGSVFAAESVIKNICDDDHFDIINPSLKYSCIKIINDNSTSFMRNFEGKLDKNFNQIKGMMFDLKKKVCYEDVKACNSQTFQMGNVDSKMRNKCTACAIVANDIDMSIKKNINNKKNKVKVEDIVDNVCDTLGYNHSPYNWLEEYCENIVEDKRQIIIDASSFRRKLYNGHFKPDQTFSESLCEELFKCKKVESIKTDL